MKRKEGLRNLALAVSNHSGIISFDIRYNPCYSLPESKKFKLIMQEKFFDNIKHEV